MRAHVPAGMALVIHGGIGATFRAKLNLQGRPDEDVTCTDQETHDARVHAPICPSSHVRSGCHRSNPEPPAARHILAASREWVTSRHTFHVLL
jgi:hypothetical protein